ncbi:DUF5009 domain-containing protein [Oleiagrimonas sp. C23AA]|uniref:DUF5009 domain-containing protein n=1 Tax=Oleiagrimonas sp. C23AA TaxID=2719047 RepID=UPI00141FA5FB|nr:DUF5009 domain-containing protein [Oleiagrimonas sp. C23AA]NII10767.1 DUF5009 domain-containing protein [Oleiagrimonas sp. C23AA]
MTHIHEPSPVPSRLQSIDVLRGLTVALMLFVNDLYEPGVPAWLVHAGPHEDGIGLADTVFPAFLFVVGLSVPFALAARRTLGDTTARTWAHLAVRTLSLLLIGFFMVNIETLNPALTGMRVFTWALAAHLCFFLVWNRYPRDWRWRMVRRTWVGLGMAGLALLAWVYRSGSPAHVGGMQISWWGILGLIGWGYLAAAASCLWLGERPWSIALVWLGFVALNMLGSAGDTTGLDPLRSALAPLLDGNVPAITLAGVFAGVLVRRHQARPHALLARLVPLGAACMLVGLVLQHWYILSKIQATPSWAMLCSGISVLAFCAIFVCVDMFAARGWQSLAVAGRNALTLYLAPNIVYYVLWLVWPAVFFYKRDDAPWLAVAGSLLWTVLMMAMVGALKRIHVRLAL